MEIKTCYEKMGANYENAFTRLQNEALIVKVARIFKGDQNYLLLKEALEKKDVEQAFFACHTLKGMCLNLGFTQLTEGGLLELNELLRSKTLEGTKKLMDQLDPIYQRTMDSLKELED